MKNEIKDSLWALYYEGEAYSVTGERIMGRQAAGNQLLKGYAKSDLTNIGIYAKNEANFKNFADEFQRLLPEDSKKSLSYIFYFYFF